MQQSLDIDDMKNLFCAFRGAFSAALSDEGVALGDEILLGLAEHEALSPAVKWILRSTAGVSDVPAEPPRPQLRLIRGGGNRSSVGWSATSGNSAA